MTGETGKQMSPLRPASPNCYRAMEVELYGRFLWSMVVTWIKHRGWCCRVNTVSLHYIQPARLWLLCLTAWSSCNWWWTTEWPKPTTSRQLQQKGQQASSSTSWLTQMRRGQCHALAISTVRLGSFCWLFAGKELAAVELVDSLISCWIDS